MNWSKLYREQIDRNIGILTEEQQEQLRTTKVAMLGLGGLGGVCFELLVRCGIGSFSIVDKDAFDATNLNRQIFAFHSTLGRKKIDVAEQFALDINPEIDIHKYEKLTMENVSEILRDVDIVALTIDELEPCLIVSREARGLGIPLVEGWGTPFCNLRVITPETPSLEEVYDLPTRGRAIDEIPDDEMKRCGQKMVESLGQIEGMSEYYHLDGADIVSTGRIPTLGPVVCLSSAILALEIIKVLLNWGSIAHGPDWSLFDPFGRRIPNNTSD